MIIILISAFLTCICYQIYIINFQIQGINRAVVNTPIELMFSSVDISGSPYFIKSQVESTLDTYYSKALTRYCKSFEAEYYYYNPTDQSMCISNECFAFEVTVECKLNASYILTRIMYYQIRDNYHG